MEYPDAMSEPEAASNQADLEALKALEADASELERLETLLDRYNVFETIGFIKDEGMHSNFLAFLLDPKRNDGLGDRVIKGVLRETLTLAQKTLPPLEFEGLDRVLENLDGMDLSQTVVRRENYDIDILLTNEHCKLAVIIENKIRAGEGPAQLEKYDGFVRHTYYGWDLLKIYLTPHGATPTHNGYVPFDHGTLCDIVDSILQDAGSTLDPDVKMSVEHYVGMVRRRIVTDPEIVELCQQIYLKHKRAFDMIYRHRPDVQKQIHDLVVALIRQEPGLAVYDDTKNGIKFGIENWDTRIPLTAENLASSGRILSFQFWNHPNVLNLDLWIQPGPEEIRQRLLEKVRVNAPDIFMKPSTITVHPLLIYRRPILKPEVYEKLDRGQREQEIRRHWHEFLDKDLPRIESALKSEA